MAKIPLKDLALIKFQKKEYIMPFQHGRLYANPFKYYRQIEEIEHDSQRGDCLESVFPAYQCDIIDSKTGLRQETKDLFFKTKYSDSYVVCMLWVNKSSGYISFTDEQKKRLPEFGDTALVITDVPDFINRVNEASEAERLEYEFKVVNYYDTNKEADRCRFYFQMIKGTRNAAFWKRDSYRYQQEARLVFSPRDKSAGHFELEIRDISDISFITDTHSLLEGMSI